MKVQAHHVQLIDLTNLEMESQIRRNTQTVNDLIRRLDAEQAQRVRQAVPGTRVGPETPAVPTGGIGPALPAVETENFPAILEMVNFGREQSIILKEQAEALVQFAQGAEAQSKLLKNVAITTVLFLIPTALTVSKLSEYTKSTHSLVTLEHLQHGSFQLPRPRRERRRDSESESTHPSPHRVGLFPRCTRICSVDHGFTSDKTIPVEADTLGYFRS